MPGTVRNGLVSCHPREKGLTATRTPKARVYGVGREHKNREANVEKQRGSHFPPGYYYSHLLAHSPFPAAGGECRPGLQASATQVDGGGHTCDFPFTHIHVDPLFPISLLRFPPGRREHPLTLSVFSNLLFLPQVTIRLCEVTRISS